MNIGFIGLGKMGANMLQHLIPKAASLWIFDVNPTFKNIKYPDNVHFANSNIEVAQNAEVVFLMLPNSKIVEDVILGDTGLIQALAPNSIIVDMSSSYYFSTLSIHQQLLAKNITLIDAPVSGGVIGAKEGKLTFMVGHYDAHQQKIEPLLEALATHIFVIGKVGGGHAIKALNNFLSASSLLATTEAMNIIKQLEIDETNAIEVFNKSSGRSFSTELKFPKYILSETYNSGFDLALLSKDVTVAHDIIKELGIQLNVLPLLDEIYKDGIMKIGYAADHTEISKYYNVSQYSQANSL